MSPAVLSPQPVVIPLSAVPPKFLPPAGGGGRIINAGEAMNAQSAVLALLWFCVMAEEDGVSIEAWIPWDGVTSHAPLHGPHSYLTADGLSVLVEPSRSRDGQWE